MDVKMENKKIEESLKTKGYDIRASIIYANFKGELEKLGNIKDNSVQVIYGEFYLPNQVQEKISLAEDLEELKISYTEVLDREEMGSLCGIRAAKKDFKTFMVINARRFLSLAERLDDFKFK